LETPALKEDGMSNDQADRLLGALFQRMAGSWSLGTYEDIGAATGAADIDHFSIRTLAYPGFGLQVYEGFLLSMGYQQTGEYHLTQSCALAKSFSHEKFPRILVSELRLFEIKDANPEFQTYIKYLPTVVPGWVGNSTYLFTGGRPWDVRGHIYEILKRESEHAAWFYTNGFVPSRVGFSCVSAAKKQKELEGPNSTVEMAGHRQDRLKKIQGSKKTGIEQIVLKRPLIWLEDSRNRIVDVPGSTASFVKRHNEFEAFTLETVDVDTPSFADD
jgi:hypothetical protein